MWNALYFIMEEKRVGNMWTFNRITRLSGMPVSSADTLADVLIAHSEDRWSNHRGVPTFL